MALYSILLAFCVSWNDRTHTTSLPAAVLNRSLICPLVSVSPATCAHDPIEQNRKGHLHLWDRCWLPLPLCLANFACVYHILALRGNCHLTAWEWG